MAIQRSDDVRPLCPRHYVVMVCTAEKPEGTCAHTSKITEAHHWACPKDGCPQNYSPSLGYFTVEKNLDYWNVTRSSSLRVIRNSTQVICGHESNNVMFIETFEAQENVQNFRCPQKDCGKTMKIPADGPPAYWLVEGFFESE